MQNSGKIKQRFSVKFGNGDSKAFETPSRRIGLIFTSVESGLHS